MEPPMDPLASNEPMVHIPQPPTPAPTPTPTPTSTYTQNHPAYSEMITAAIAALREREGSSRQAIARYIERVYSGLPPTHSALLTQHLKLMKSNGQLVMVKHSYMLPGSSPPPPPPPPPTIGNGDVSATSAKRGPGRPRKVLSYDMPAAVPAPAPAPVVSTGRPRGRPPVAATPVSQVGVKRGRGRPPKSGPKPRGRPRKNAYVAPAATGAGYGAGGGFVAAQVVPIADVNATPASYSGLSTGKRRGRPPKFPGETRKVRKLSGKPLGRPRKVSATSPAVGSSDPQLSVVVQNLKGKLDYFQTVVKQSVNVIKPCLNSQTPAAAIAACQDLEELAAMDVGGAPLNVQQQPPVPPS